MPRDPITPAERASTSLEAWLRQLVELGRFTRDLFLRLAFRIIVTDRSLAWMYDYRVDWPAESRTEVDEFQGGARRNSERIAHGL